ncbi:MAG: hypothetical protein IJZ32_04715 [Clostridia bacterium]|nr:hypothetical protein [Clostridia bacterium]
MRCAAVGVTLATVKALYLQTGATAGFYLSALLARLQNLASYPKNETAIYNGDAVCSRGKSVGARRNGQTGGRV